MCQVHATHLQRPRHGHVYRIRCSTRAIGPLDLRPRTPVVRGSSSGTTTRSENDYAGADSEDPVATSEAFLVRRAAAYQAWWSTRRCAWTHRPVPTSQITRDLRYGTLALPLHAL